MSTAVVETRIDENGVEWIGEYEIHPDAAMLPMMDGESFAALCDSIEQFGLKKPIKQDEEGRILDGRNRLLACLTVGVVPEFEPDDSGVTSQEFVELENIQRRDLTKSQRAMLGAKWFGGDMSAVEIAQRVGCSESGVTKALALLKQSPELSDMVEVGELSVTTAESFTKLPEETQSAVMETFGDASDTVGTKAKAVKQEVRKQTVKQESEEPETVVAESVPFIYERWFPNMEKTLSRLLKDVPVDLQDRCKVAIGQTLSVRIRHTVEDAEQADEMEGLSFVGNDAETMLIWIDGKLQSMKPKKREAALKAIQEKYTFQQSKAKEVVFDTRVQFDGLPDEEKEKFNGLVAKEFGIESAPAGGKPSAYLPALPEDHVAACAVVKAEVSQRVKDMRGFSGWENGKAEAIRGLSKYVEGSGKKLRSDAGVDGTPPATPEIFDTTWPEHLDTDAVKKAWDLYVESRRSAKMKVDSDLLQLRIGELSCYEESKVVEMLIEARAGAKGPWAGFNHDGIKERFGVTRDKTGKLLGKSDVVKPAGDEWGAVISCLRKYSPEHQLVEIRKALPADVFAAAKAVGLVRIEQATTFEKKDLRESFFAELSEVRQKV